MNVSDCKNKIVFATLAEAQAEVVKRTFMPIEKMNEHGPTQAAFKCSKCGMFHCTSQLPTDRGNFPGVTLGGWVSAEAQAAFEQALALKVKGQKMANSGTGTPANRKALSEKRMALKPIVFGK